MRVCNCLRGVLCVVNTLMRCARACAAAVMTMLLIAPVATPAFAEKNDASPVETPAEARASKARGVLKAHCARCHQTGRLKIARPAGGFGNVLDLDALARNPSRVRPGLPDASRLYTLMYRREMPHDRRKRTAKGARPYAKDVQAIRDWIAGLAQPKLPASSPLVACKGRVPIHPGAVTAAIARDLTEVSPDVARHRRYVSIAHLHNACDPSEALHAHRQAIGRLLNALSWAAVPVRLHPIDEQRTVLRFSLADLAWERARWSWLVSHYHYNSRTADEASRRIRALSSTDTPVVNADWLAYVAMRPPLYGVLLGLPGSFAKLISKLSISMLGGRTDEDTRHLRVRGDLAAHHQGVPERRATRHGALWLIGQGEVKASGRPDSTGDRKASAAVRGGLALFSLPNGFEAFYARDGQGKSVPSPASSPTRMPVQIPTATSSALACLGCHGSGVRTASAGSGKSAAGPDPRQIRKQESDNGAPRLRSALRRAADADRKRLREAMIAAGLDPDLSVHGVEPVNALAARYARDITLQQAASELQVTPAALLAGTQRVEGALLWVRRMLLQGSVPRHLFERAYPSLQRTLGRTPVGRQGHVLFGPKVQHSAQARHFPLSIMADKDAYKAGDNVRLTVRTSEPCHLTLINVDATGKATILVPNDFDRDTLLPANRDVQVPTSVEPKYRFRAGRQGPETIVAICNATWKGAYGFTQNFERQKFTELGDFRTALARAYSEAQYRARIAGRTKRKRRRRRAQSGNKRPVPLLPDVMAHTAIRLHIRPVAD